MIYQSYANPKNSLASHIYIEELVTKQRYRCLTQQIQGFDLSLKGILFDFCLDAMECDTLNAKLYLRHAFIYLDYIQGFTSCYV
jgi:hypothetical protein